MPPITGGATASGYRGLQSEGSTGRTPAAAMSSACARRAVPVRTSTMSYVGCVARVTLNGPRQLKVSFADFSSPTRVGRNTSTRSPTSHDRAAAFAQAKDRQNQLKQQLQRGRGRTPS